MDKPAAALQHFAAPDVTRDCSSAPDRRSAAPAFQDVYRDEFDFVWRSLRGLTVGTRISIEDAAQDVWLVVTRRLDEFRGDSSLRTWLFAVARNVVQNHRRQQQRKGGLESFDETLEETTPAADGCTPEEFAAWRDVRLFMSTLNQDAREVFLCRFLLEMTPREVASATGRNVVFIYTETRNLRASFKRWHESREDEEP